MPGAKAPVNPPFRADQPFPCRIGERRFRCMRVMATLFLLFTLPALAQEPVWVEPDIDTAPPPLEEALEQAARERAREEKARENRRFLSDIRRARELLHELNGLVGEVTWAAEALARVDRPGAAPALVERRRAQYDAVMERAFAKQAAARVVHFGLAERNPDSALVGAVGAAMDKLQQARREAAMIAEPQG